MEYRDSSTASEVNRWKLGIDRMRGSGDARHVEIRNKALDVWQDTNNRF